MPFALIELPFSELAALIGIIGAVWGAAWGVGSYFFNLWLNTKFISKKAFYHEKDLVAQMFKTAETERDALGRRIIAIEQKMELNAQPMAAVVQSMEEMKDEFRGLTEKITEIQIAVGIYIREHEKKKP